MAARITLLTGCSSGIGLAAAVCLAQDPAHGYIVYATMRNLAKKTGLEDAAGDALGKTLFVLELDVTKEDTITAAVKTITDKHGRVDILVNNAAFGCFGFIERIRMDQIRLLLETNLLGTIRVTQEVIPFMKKQRSGRIVNISSLAGFNAFPFSEIYVTSKFALEGFSESLALSLLPFNVKVSIIQPGPVKTAFMANVRVANQQTKRTKIEDDLNTDPVSKEHYMKFMAHLSKDYSKADVVQRATDIAAIIKTALEAEKPHLKYPTSDFGQGMAEKRFVDPTGDSIIRQFTNIFLAASL